ERGELLRAGVTGRLDFHGTVPLRSLRGNGGADENLSGQTGDRLAPAQRRRPALGVMNLYVEGHAQAVEDRGRQVVGTDRRLGGVGGPGVGAAVNLAAADAASGQQHRLAEAPVVAAAVLV